MSFLETGMNGQLREWTIKGPRGAVVARLAEAPGFGQALSVFLHVVNQQDGAEPDTSACDVTGRPCWHDAIVGRLTRTLLHTWEVSGEDEQVIQRRLAEWYGELLPSVGADR